MSTNQHDPFQFSLPPELVLHIFSYLNTSELCVALQVNTTWNQWAQDPSLWTTLDIPPISQIEKRLVHPRFSCVRCITIRCPSFSLLQFVCKQFCGLRELFIIDANSLPDNAMTLVGQSLPHLLTFKVCNLSSRCSNLPHVSQFHTALTSLDIHHTNMCDVDMQELVSRCYRLESLSIRGCKNVTPQAVASIAASLPHLTRLEIYGCRGESQTDTFTHMTQLKTLITHESVVSKFREYATTALQSNCPSHQTVAIQRLCELLSSGGVIPLDVAVPYFCELARLFNPSTPLHVLCTLVRATYSALYSANVPVFMKCGALSRLVELIRHPNGCVRYYSLVILEYVAGYSREACAHVVGHGALQTVAQLLHDIGVDTASLLASNSQLDICGAAAQLLESICSHSQCLLDSEQQVVVSTLYELFVFAEKSDHVVRCCIRAVGKLLSTPWMLQMVLHSGICKLIFKIILLLGEDKYEPVTIYNIGQVANDLVRDLRHEGEHAMYYLWQECGMLQLMGGRPKHKELLPMWRNCWKLVVHLGHAGNLLEILANGFSVAVANALRELQRCMLTAPASESMLLWKCISEVLETVEVMLYAASQRRKVTYAATQQMLDTGCIQAVLDVLKLGQHHAIRGCIVSSCSSVLKWALAAAEYTAVSVNPRIPLLQEYIELVLAYEEVNVVTVLKAALRQPVSEKPFSKLLLASADEDEDRADEDEEVEVPQHTPGRRVYMAM